MFCRKANCPQDARTVENMVAMIRILFTLIPADSAMWISFPTLLKSCPSFVFMTNWHSRLTSRIKISVMTGMLHLRMTAEVTGTTSSAASRMPRQAHLAICFTCPAFCSSSFDFQSRNPV